MNSIEGKKQVGVIVSGGGTNFRAIIEEYKAHGYAVRLCGDYCELYA